MKYTIVDLATTGIGTEDRIVEIGLLEFGPDKVVTRTFETLINPGRDIPNSTFHGINEAMVEQAPEFSEIADLVHNYLASTDLVMAFNIRLDWRMLGYQFQSLGQELPQVEQLCLTHHFRKVAPTSPRRLKEMCDFHQVVLTEPNRASAKVEATYQVLSQYAHTLPRSTVMRNRCKPIEDDAPRFSRDDSREKARIVTPILDRLTSRLPRHKVDSNFDTYFELLDDVFADSVLEHKEAVALYLRASELGMNQNDTQRAHEAYVEGLLEVAYEDGFYTEMEADHLEAVAAALNVTDVIRSDTGKKLSLYPRDLSGKTTCFSGPPRGTLEGRRIGDGKLAELTKDAGLTLAGKVTAELDFLVHTESKGSAEKVSQANQLKVPLVSEQVFWNWLGVQVL